MAAAVARCVDYDFLTWLDLVQHRFCSRQERVVFFCPFFEGVVPVVV